MFIISAVPLAGKELQKQGYYKGNCKGYCKSEKIIEAIKANPFIIQEELAQDIGITKKSIVLNIKNSNKQE